MYMYMYKKKCASTINGKAYNFSLLIAWRFCFQAPNNQVVYSANGDQSAIQYFDINESSGKVLVKQPLYTGTSSQYIVRIFF